jgi:hypothetical protein
MSMTAKAIWVSASLALLALAACSSQPASAPASTTPATGTASGTTTHSVQLTSKVPASPTDATFDVALADPAGAPAAQTAAAVIGQKIGACWKAPGAAGAPAVLLRITLADDGTVGAVETVEKKRFAGEPGYRAAATAATKAVLQCAPFTLSAADYAAWKQLTLKLTPRNV